jgi:cell division protein FtsW
MKAFGFSRTDRSALARWWWTVDKGLLASVLTLIVFGVALVSTASPPVAVRIGLDHSHFVIRHLSVILPALVLMLGISVLDHRKIRRLATVVFFAGVVMMMIVPFIGMDIKGAQRWIHLPGFSLQPSEFVKPAFAVVAAWLIAHQKQKPGFPGYIMCAGLYFLVVSLLMLQPDFGMTMVVTCMFAGQVFLAGLPFRYLAILMVAGIIGVIAVYSTFGHVQSRIDRFLDPQAGDTYQIDRSLEAFANGGLLGTGPGQGTIKNTIPDGHADFIFSVAGEELGLLFTLVIVGLYAFILLRGFNRLMESGDLFVVLAVGGILCMFGLQALVHMGSSLHLLPTKGMTLPFISYGGSSTLSMGIAMGVVLGLTRRETRTSIARGGLTLSTMRKGAAS